VWKCSSAALRLDVQGQLRQVERYDRTTTEERDMIGGVVKQGSGKKFAIFDRNRLSPKRYERYMVLLWITNRKS